ncbi:IclR family transcriptional regulator [Victivallis sp. Marseille-Q1083]|uniref:IclR family transcriptional regulator n=1 Tax=Victivallis sp. Marseille-Q1083 TaxID=2717288 RepID=UPI00158B2C80|nr:IclR family transcriptional regulator [Victivallis sp. Marseille-Q1083]
MEVILQNEGKAKKREATYAVPAAEALLELVEYLSNHPEGCGVSELARRLNLSTNLTFRIMKCLLERGYVEADENVVYRLSARWLSLGALVANNFSLTRLARSYLEELCQTLEFSCLLQTLEKDHMLVRDAVAPSKAFYLQVTSGVQLAIGGNAFAKAVLAYSTPEVQREIIAGLTSRPQFSPDAFLAELEQARREKLAYDWEEYTKGIFCIASPVFSTGDLVVGAIGATGLVSHLSAEKCRTVEAQVRNQAANLSRAIGGNGGLTAGRPGLNYR